MWIVELALRRPYTFLVMALLILLATPLVLLRMSTDIFPEINIPVISIVWTYSGLSAQEIGQRITSVNERSLTTTVNDIEHIESESITGFAIIKIFFQPNANIPTAIAQVVAIEQAQLRQLPPGILPPLVIKYSASAIPVIQLGVSSPSMTEQAVFDTAVNFLRPRLVTIPGVAIPYPYGGKTRVISVDLDINALLAKGLTPSDVVNAISAQNLILPSGTAKIGATEYVLATNASPDTIAGLNRIPIVTRNGATTYISEVAHVRDGFSPQTNIVRQNGERGVLVSIIKNGSSTLDIVKGLMNALPVVEQTLPKDVKITPLFDQSGFVRAAISGVVREALIAACLTAALILLFLGNWRSTCIIAVSIPLSILTSIIALYITGETLNIMTLGGLALAVGILVDDATVTIENIERHLHLGSDLHKAILEGAGEIAIPALVSTLCICIVFVPMFFLSGVARYLFAPLAEAVVYAMLASYVLSRTLVPTLVMLFMGHSHIMEPGAKPSPLQRVYRAFDARFEGIRAGYLVILGTVLERRRLFAGYFLGFCALSCCLVFILGRDFFPNVDAGQIRLHMRLPSGTRVEQTARVADEVEAAIRGIIPPRDLGTVLDNLGVAVSGINKTYSNSGTFASLDGEIQLSLNDGHAPTEHYVEAMRRELPRRFPGVEFFFQPADMVTQILNFGVPAALDVKVTGAGLRADYDVAAELKKRIEMIPGTVDTHIHQRPDVPTIMLSMDRTQLQQLGLSPSDVTNDLLVSTAGTTQTSPAFWLNPSNGIVYNLAVQSPQYTVDSLDALMQTPVRAAGAAPTTQPQLLSNLVAIHPAAQIAVDSRYNLAPSVDVFSAAQGRDMGSIARDVRRVVDDIRPHLPRGMTVTVLGQVQTMRSSFVQLGVGLVMAVVMVYLLIVVNFQSWVDAFIIITALPAALAGICWMLFLSATTLSVPAMTGAIMTMGVATANSILVVAFARQRMDEGLDPVRAALDAGATRIRPVLMTALAMIIGMIPMALGLGEGAEQNAPLGRAVIGGLIFATVSTLLFVPVIFAGTHRRLELRKARHGLVSSAAAEGHS
jgi:multidrug efflux pump subunit AcrB